MADTEPAQVLILSAEDDPETTLRPRLEAAGADMDRIHLLESVVLRYLRLATPRSERDQVS